jgi:carboxyl-terminal processing protease
MFALALLAVHQLPAPDFTKAWEEVEGQIRGRYYARKTRKAEMDRLLTKYAPQAKGAKTEREFDLALDAMTRDFGDSHFDFLTRSEPGFYLMDSLVNGSKAAPIAHIGAWLRPEGDGMTVQMVLNGGEAEKAGLRKGDVLFAIDGGRLGVDRLKGRKEVQIRRRRGTEESVLTLPVKEQGGTEMFLDATKASIRVIPHEGRKIGYIHVWTMASDDFYTTLLSALKGSLRDTDGLILDLRDGFGGRPGTYSSAFKETYKKPLIILTNEGTRSAKEVVSHQFKQSKRGRLVGKRTAGHVLGTWPYSMTGNWAYLEIPLVEYPANGVRLEKNGVQPDVEVPEEFDAEGRDLILNKGLDLLKTIPVGA